MWRALIVLTMLMCVVGCGRDHGPAEQFTLYSIDGRAEPLRLKGVDVKPTGTFHGYPVLGKVEIKDPAQREELIAALKDARTRAKLPAKCFWPRHGIRIVENGKTVEYVICFECSRIEEYLNGARVRHEPLNPDVEPAFSRPLVDAKIPIAPKLH